MYILEIMKESDMKAQNKILFVNNHTEIFRAQEYSFIFGKKHIKLLFN